MQNMKHAIFMIGEEEYGMDIMDVNIIEKYIPVQPATNLPKNLKGTINLRGDAIPVYSLRRKFGLEEVEPNNNTRYIITTSNGILTAYEVDKMMEIIEFEENQIFKTPFIVQNKDTAYIKLVANVDERMIILINHDGILSEEEQDKMKAVINK